jgi:hypothetical protein
MHRDVVLKKVVLQILLSILNHHLFLNFEKIFIFELVRAKNVFFFIDFLMCRLVTFLKIFKDFFSLILRFILFEL